MKKKNLTALQMSNQLAASELTTLKEDAAIKVTEGITTLEEAASAIIV